MSESVYVLGAGGIGCLVSYPLAKAFKLNLIVRSIAKREYLRENANKIQFKQLFNEGNIVSFVVNGVYTADRIPDKRIKNLIVSVKTFDTISAIKPLMEKIDRRTNILFVQNGMGVIDEVYAKLWPEKSIRPAIYQGVISHGVYQELSERNTFNYVHAGFSGLKICKMPRSLEDGEQMVDGDGNLEEAPSFIQTLITCGKLNAKYYTYKDLLVYQVQKLMVNECMNAVTTILDCINFELYTKTAVVLFREIISESLNVLNRSMPILKESTLYDSILNVDSLVEYTKKCGFIVNGKNSTSMRQDVLNLRDVEIQYINGYVVKQGKKVGYAASVNKAIVLLVKTRMEINRDRASRDS